VSGPEHSATGTDVEFELSINYVKTEGNVVLICVFTFTFGVDVSCFTTLPGSLLLTGVL